MHPCTRLRRTAAPALVCLLVWLLACLIGAEAHFAPEGRNRVIIVDRQDEGIRIFMRVPSPLLYARELAARRSRTDRVEAPFVIAEKAEDGFFHRFDLDVIRTDPQAFAAFVADGYQITIAGREAEPAASGVRIHRLGSEPAFTTPGEAEATVAGPPVADDEHRLFVGDTVTDIALTFPGAHADGAVGIGTRLPPMALPAGIFIDNHVIDFSAGEGRVTSVAGQLQEPVVLDRSTWRAARTFTVQGILHIIEGPDHVLFVLCLAIGAISTSRLLWQVTGFTVGHSITLIAGFLGYVPQTAWFVPVVEAAIALSIIYAAVAAIVRPASAMTILVTTLIGLLHGFGFSFVLGNILGPAAPHLLVSLVSFNIGVEIGQLLIVGAAFGGLRLVRRFDHRAAAAFRAAVAAGSVAVACVWLVQRSDMVVASLGSG